ncbi:MAG: hypothetical protein HFJ72_08585 [Adlercreutzia sp.]|nr:hypothetical protein [Adlercreutzia sp.]
MSEVKKGLTVKVKADMSEFRAEIKRSLKAIRSLNDELERTCHLASFIPIGQASRTEDTGR